MNVNFPRWQVQVSPATRGHRGRPARPCGSACGRPRRPFQGSDTPRRRSTWEPPPGWDCSSKEGRHPFRQECPPLSILLLSCECEFLLPKIPKKKKNHQGGPVVFEIFHTKWLASHRSMEANALICLCVVCRTARHPMRCSGPCRRPCRPSRSPTRAPGSWAARRRAPSDGSLSTTWTTASNRSLTQVLKSS